MDVEDWIVEKYFVKSKFSIILAEEMKRENANKIYEFDKTFVVN